MKQLEDEQLQLVKALEETTRNLSEAAFVIRTLAAKLRQTMTEEQINALFGGNDNVIQKHLPMPAA